MVTHSPPTSEFGGSNPVPLIGKLVIAYDGRQFRARNLDELYVQVFSADKTTHRDMTCTVLKTM